MAKVKKAKDFAGVHTIEVWDHRLSMAVPLIRNDGETWVVHIFAKDNPDYDPENPNTFPVPLESHDTEIPWEKGDAHDAAKVAACYEWLHSVREKYSREDIEEIKPLVAKVNEANAALAARLSTAGGE